VKAYGNKGSCFSLHFRGNVFHKARAKFTFDNIALCENDKKNYFRGLPLPYPRESGQGVERALRHTASATNKNSKAKWYL